MFKDVLPLMIETVLAAGKVVKRLQTAPLQTKQKTASHDMVTAADYAVNQLLYETFTQQFPDWGWLSEETQDNRARLSCETVWIIDPIDGTREFVAGIPEYAISVALVHQGNPVLAVVYNPAQNELFSAQKGKGAWCNGERIYCKRGTQGEMTILASRSEYQRGEWRAFIHRANIVPMGSIAYKLALVAKGAADASFSLGNKNEWDVAASVLLLAEAGGKSNLIPFTFNRPQVLIDYIVGASADAWPRVNQLIGSINA